MKQTKLVSLIEVWLNVLTGVLVAMGVWAFIIPVLFPRMAGPVAENLVITLTFTAFSIFRSYFWRRFFNNGVHRTVVNWVGKLFTLRVGFPPACEPYHLAAALGDKPCKICGTDSWMSKYRVPGEEILKVGGAITEKEDDV